MGIAGSVDRGTRVVVLAVESGAFTMSDYIIGETTVALIGLQAVQGFTVVPRSEVNMAIGGLPISTSGFVSNAMAHSVGGLLNAQFVVVGAFESIAGAFRLRLQLIEVATANVRVVQTIDVVNDAMVAYFMGGAATARGARAPRAPRAPRPPGPTFIDPDNWLSWGGYGRGTNLRYERNRSDTLALGVNLFYSTGPLFSEAPISFGDVETWEHRAGAAFGLMGTGRLFPGGGPFYLELGLGLGSMSGQVWESWGWVTWGPMGGWESYTNLGLMISPAIGWRLGGRRPWAGWAWSWFWDITIAAPVVIGTEGLTARFKPGVSLGFAW
ncbi:MAG: hypothetical protein FWC64_11795 [Treponema sp.]|nr:hypothetical protein [Treponema sp.]